MQQTPPLMPGEDIEIDLFAMGRRILKSWKILVLGAILGAGAGAGAGFWSGPTYQGRMLILETGTTATSGLSSLGSLKSLMGGGSDDLGSLELFKALLGSRIVAERVVRCDIVDPRTDSVKKVYRVLGMDPADPFRWDKALDGLTKAVKVTPVGGGVFELGYQSGSPWQAKEMLDIFYREAMDELRNASRDRFRTSLQSLRKGSMVAKEEMQQALSALASFRARNLAVVSAVLFAEQSRLDVEYQIKEKKYLAARQEYEAMLLEREKYALPAMVLSPAVRPVRPFKPNWTMLIAGGAVAGLVVAAGLALLRMGRSR